MPLVKIKEKQNFFAERMQGAFCITTLLFEFPLQYFDIRFDVL